MNQRISDYQDYIDALTHEYCISTGERKEQIKREIFKEIAEKYEYDHPRVRLEVDHDGDYDLQDRLYRERQEEIRYEERLYRDL